MSNATNQIEFGGRLTAAPKMGDGDIAPAGVSGARFATSLTLASGGTISSLLDCSEAGCLCGLQLGGGSINAAGTLYLLASNGTAPVARLQDKTGATISLVWAANTAVFSLPMDATFPWRYFKVDMGAAQGGAAMTVTAITRGL